MNLAVDERLAREVATLVSADVRTVRRVMRNEPVRGLVGQRIQAELEKRGYHNPRPTDLSK